MAQVAPVHETPDYNGGIQEFGNFDEGFCFKVNQTSGDSKVWIICTKSQEKKMSLMNFMRKIKLKAQRDQGLIITGEKEPRQRTLENVLYPPPEGSELTRDAKGNLGVSFDHDKKLTDGYWVVLSDWSQCSLKCGGGESLLQRMCVPPKNGGLPCEGDAILRRKCNLEPCPNPKAFNAKPSKYSNTTMIMKPSVKVMPFSSRPQRYSKCVIKEADLMYTLQTKDQNEKDVKLQIPTRVVMNNKTISAYAGEHYDLLKVAFDLTNTVLSPSKDHEYCFILNDPSKEGEFCFFAAESDQAHYDQWDYDFHLFKFQCRIRKPIQKLNELDKEEFKNRMKEEREGLLLDQEQDLIKKQEEQKEDEIQTKVVQTNKVALQAIQKELNLDSLIEREEKQRELTIEAKLKEEIENQYNLRVQEKAKELEEVKKKAAQEVLIKRSNLKKKVIDMRKKAKRRENKLRQELLGLRNKIHSEINDAWKKGSIHNCIAALKSKKEYKHYCMKAFPNEPVKYGGCINSYKPCDFCCQHEFSDMYLQEQGNCISKICDNNKQKVDGLGRWVWEESINEAIEDEPQSV